MNDLDLEPIFSIYKLNDGKYIIKVELDSCEDENDSLIIDYKRKKEEDPEDELVITASDIEEICGYVKKYLPIIKYKKEDDIVKMWEKVKV